MNALTLAFRLLRRDWRAGELRVLTLAVLIAVAAVTTVSFFTDRVRQALDLQASQLLAADLAIVSDHPLRPDFSTEAAKSRLRVAHTVAFPSMVLHGERTHLAEIRGVGEGYPLRGKVRISDRLFGPERDAAAVPRRGTVWADGRLLARLALSVGDELEIGAARFTVAAVLIQEPDRAGDLFSIAPHLVLNLGDLAATGLVQPASRVSHRMLLAGEGKSIAAFRNWAQHRVGRGERLEGVRDARPEIRAALERAQKYLGLAALVSAVLAAVAIALAARRFMQRHLDSCAIMRCFGASQALIFRLYLYQFLWLGLLAGLVGSLVGFGAQAALGEWLRTLAVGDLPRPTLRPLAEGLLTAVALLLGFALPSLLRLGRVPPLRVLRREFGPPERLSVLSHLLGFAVVSGLLIGKAGDVRLGLYVLAGLAAAMMLAAALAWFLMRLISRLSGRVPSAWYYGLANIRRRAGGSIAQVVAFGLGIMALLLLTLVRGDLLESWRGSLPPDAPNRFLINIQPAQVEPLRRFLLQNGVPAPEVFPMVRGRLAAINGRAVAPADFPDERARRLVEREFNLSWARAPQQDNQIVAGRWWSDADRGKPLLSVEEGIAKTLGIRLGDSVTYEIAGVSISARVASLRKVEWDSFRVNFFVVAPPGLLESYPASHITSFYLPEGNDAVLNQLVRSFPNLTVIDVAAIMRQVRAIIDRVTGAVEFVFGFTLLAGVVVLYAAIVATQDERLFEAAILRALGASRRYLLAGQAAEFAGIGMLAGLAAAAGATGTAYVLSTRVLGLPFSFNPWVWMAGVGAGGAWVVVAGLLGTGKILARPPLETLRSQG